MGDAQAGARPARAGAGRTGTGRTGNQKTGVRRRAVGTRNRIISFLATAGEVADSAGMASTRLSEAVAYPGSSVAFAQLLSGMERDGLLAREVRGKRTYRIALAPGVRARRTDGSGHAQVIADAEQARTRRAGTDLPQPTAHGGWLSPRGAGTERTAGLTGALRGQVPAGGREFDYDELARRLLVQVIRRLATPDADADADAVVADLERELAEAQSQNSVLASENHALREELGKVRRTLDRAYTELGAEEDAHAAREPVTAELTDAEIVLLDRMVSPGREGAKDTSESQPGANAS